MSEPDKVLLEFLAPTKFIDSEAPELVSLALSLKKKDDRDTAIALFDWVRDHIKYNPYAALDGADRHLASAVLANGHGYCVQKAVLLAALGRAAGLPSRLGFADVRNHQLPEKLRKAMGTDLFVFHGYTEFYIDGRWIKATPAFDLESAERIGVLPVELDGENDAMLHPVDPRGQPYIEYLKDRGTFAELPYEEMWKVFVKIYGGLAAYRD